jgi:hypothetical protein
LGGVLLRGLLLHVLLMRCLLLRVLLPSLITAAETSDQTAHRRPGGSAFTRISGNCTTHCA